MLEYYERKSKLPKETKDVQIFETEEEALKAFERIQRHNLAEAAYCYDNIFCKPNFIRRQIGYKNDK